MPRPPALFVVLLAASALAPAVLSADNEGLGVTPPSVEVEDALPGQVYERRVTVQNQFDTTTRIDVEHLGEVGAWTMTDHGDTLSIPPRSQADLVLSIAVPADAYVGDHAGQVRVVADPKDQPEESGLAVRYAIAVTIVVSVGGDPVERLEWVGASADDVEVGTPPVVTASVENKGNVLSTASVVVELSADGRDDVLASERGEDQLVPGQRLDIPVAFEESLPEGDYVARVRADPPGAFEREVPFRVLPPGALGKEGTLRALVHEPWVDAGLPVKVVCLFENSGSTAIARAICTVEVADGARLLRNLASEPRVVPVGETVELAVFYTPERGGTQDLTGRVSYDGFETPPVESFLNVQQTGAVGETGSAFLWVVLAIVAGLLLLVLLMVLGRRRKRGRAD